MYESKRKKGVARFTIRPSQAVQTVLLAGDFTDWKPLPMKKQKGGGFVADVEVPAGTYQYKFILDGRWQADPDNHALAMNPFGTLNSVAQVE